MVLKTFSLCKLRNKTTCCLERITQRTSCKENNRWSPTPSTMVMETTDYEIIIIIIYLLLIYYTVIIILHMKCIKPK